MLTVKYSADFENLDAIRELVGEFARRAGFDEKTVYSIQLATDEACSNVIEHAYKGIPGGEIEISCQTTDEQIAVIVRDHGRVFDFSSAREPNLSPQLSERQIGGLGIYFIRRLMDEVRFESNGEAGNTLTMIKKKAGKV